MEDKLRQTIQEFFDARLRDSFPDPNFAFDVYIPPPHDKVWLVDVNPWAMRTDPLLFSWMELLTMEVPDVGELKDEAAETTIRLRLARPGETINQTNEANEEASDGDETDEEGVEDIWQPEFRLVRSDDPEAYGFSTPQYSAHKLPKDVVDASSGEGHLREFALQWQEAQKLAEQQRQEDSEDD